jgi:hypothetical protein
MMCQVLMIMLEIFKYDARHGRQQLQMYENTVRIQSCLVSESFSDYLVHRAMGALCSSCVTTTSMVGTSLDITLNILRAFSGFFARLCILLKQWCL